METVQEILDNNTVLQLECKVNGAYKEWIRLNNILSIKKHIEDEKR
tara:strand:+ start:51 stop:188 length:138 start_codon:yes stop_codon:yes gene_type:complete